VIRAARIASALLLFSVLVQKNAEAVDLNWSAVNTAVDGSSIPALIIYYKVYWSSDDTDWNYAADTADTFLNLDAITAGCYFLHVTAVRSDTDQESAPSTSLQYCYGDVGAEPPSTVTAEPSSPQGMNVQ
jgi:hypothetical protein